MIGGLLTAPNAQARTAPGWLSWSGERMNPCHGSLPFSQRLVLFKPLLQLGKGSRIILSSRRKHCMVSACPDWVTHLCEGVPGRAKHIPMDLAASGGSPLLLCPCRC